MKGWKKEFMMTKRWWFIGAFSLAAIAAACGDDGGGGTPDAEPVPLEPQLQIAPAMQDFGDLTVGGVSAATTFTVSNVGDGDGVAQLNASLSGANASDFNVATDNCSGVTLNAGSSCTISITFEPGAEGAKTASLDVTGDNNVTSALMGNGITPGALAIAPSPHNFGNVVVGQSSASQTFTVSNTGQDDTGTITVNFSGGNATEFTVGTDGCSNTTLAGGATCDVEVTFTPTSSGAKTTNLSATSSPGGTVNAVLNGNGQNDAVVVLEPPTQGFGTVTQGSQSNQIVFQATNNGDVATGTLATTKGGADPDDWTILQDLCDGQTLAPAASCAITIVFAPLGTTATGPKNATLAVSGTPGGTDTSVLTGNSSAPGSLSITGDGVFDPTTVGQTSQAKSFTVTNNGGSSTGALAVLRAGSNPNDFPFGGAGDTCSNVVLGPGASCVITIVFSPQAAGNRAATVTVSGNPGGSVFADLSGLGLSPAVLVTTSDVSNTSDQDFGNVSPGSMSAPIQFTIRNTGDATSGPVNVVITGLDFTQFTLVNQTCNGITLAANQTCSAVVQFAPTTVGFKTATLRASANPGGNGDATITGDGQTPAALQIAPGVANFGAFVQDTSSADLANGAGNLVFTVTNTGIQATGVLQVSEVVAGAADDTDEYTIVNDLCTGQILNLNQSCTVTVTFDPIFNEGFGPTNQDPPPGLLKRMNLQVTAPAGPGGTATSSLSGTSLPQLTLTGLATFPNTFVGSSSVQSYEVRNTDGASPSDPTRTITIQDLNDANNEFFVQNNNCTTLAPGVACQFDTRFTPVFPPGPASATIQATDQAGENGIAFIDLSATKLDILTIDPLPAAPFPFNDDHGGGAPDFPSLPGTPENTRVRRTFEVRNNSASTDIPAVSTFFTRSGDFDIVSSTCGGQLSANSTCLIVVEFFPLSAQNANGSIQVVATPAGGTDTENFTATGISQANVGVSGNPDFGTVRATNSQVRQFTFTNNGAEAAESVQIGFGAGHAASFGANNEFTFTDNCGSVLAGSGGSCTATVTFTPNQNTSPQVFNPVFQVDFTGDPSEEGNGTAGGTTAVNMTGTSDSQLSIQCGTFNPTELNVASAPVQCTVTNNGPTTVVSTTATFTGPYSLDAPTSNCGSLDLNETCQIGMRCTPTDPGDDNDGTVTVGTLAGTKVLANLSCEGLDHAVLTFDSGGGVPYTNGIDVTAGFGGMNRGANSVQRTFTLTNNGQVAANLNTNIDPVNNGQENDWLVQDNCNQAQNGPLAGGASCTYVVSFFPQVGDTGDDLTDLDLGIQASFTNVVANSSCSNPPDRDNPGTNCPTVVVQGQQQDDLALQFSPSFVDFDPDTFDGQTGTFSFNVINNTGQAVDISSGDTTVFQFGGGEFSHDVGTSTCDDATVVNGGNCSIVIDYDPVSAGLANIGGVAATPRQTGGSLLTDLRGIGGLNAESAARGNITIDHGNFGATFNYDTVTEGGFGTALNAQTTETFTITNTGDETVNGLNVTIAGDDANQYPVVTNGCASGTLLGGGSCDLLLNFDPVGGATGPRDGIIDVTTSTAGVNCTGATCQLILIANAVNAANLGLSPSVNQQCGTGIAVESVNAAGCPGDLGNTHLFRLTNNGGVPTGVITLLLEGTNPGDFSFDNSDNCSTQTLDPGTSCTFIIDYTPTFVVNPPPATTSHSATIRGTEAKGATSITTNLAGTSVGALIFEPDDASDTGVFGNVGVDSSATHDFEIRNAAGTPATGPLVVTLSGNVDDFNIVSNACNGAVLAAGGACNLDVSCAPNETGGTTGTLTVEDPTNTPNKLAVLPLSCTGN